MAKWRYKNETGSLVYWQGHLWLKGEEFNVNAPVPAELGLTCTQEGDTPDPILLHEDFILPDGAEAEVDLPEPKQSKTIALTLLNLLGGGAECRFNSRDGIPIPLDIRGFQEDLPWEMCAKMFFKNISGVEIQLSVSAVEVVR